MRADAINKGANTRAFPQPHMPTLFQTGFVLLALKVVGSSQLVEWLDGLRNFADQAKLPAPGEVESIGTYFD
jgi:hypothetical protein